MLSGRRGTKSGAASEIRNHSPYKKLNWDSLVRPSAPLYDALNRVALATENTSNTSAPSCPDSGSAWCELFIYDSYGNRTMSQASYTGLVAPQTFNASNNRIADSGWGYDTAGNVNQDPLALLIYKYDAEGRLVAACNSANDTVATCTNQAGAGRAIYAYDGKGRRVSKIFGSVATTFVYDTRGNLSAEYGGTASSTSGTMYLTADQLGSTRVITNSAQTAIARHDFRPFGDEVARSGVSGYGSNASVDLEFTSKERDAESGLDFFGARYMSSAQGRWTSPDAINLTDERILNPSNTLNKYIYGGNNPLKYVDPDGRDITVFYTNTGPAGHFWMAASDPGGQQSAILDFGPANGASRVSEALGRDVPGNTNYAAHMPSADEIRQDYTSLTIQTNPEDTQKAINAINSTNASLTNYNVYGPNCTTVCRDVLHKILGLDTNSIRPTALWSDIFLKWSKQAMQPRQSTSRGTPAPQVQSTHGVDYGNPRYGMNTFDFVWMLLQQQNQPQPTPQVTSKICYTDENGKQVCQ